MSESNFTFLKSNSDNTNIYELCIRAEKLVKTSHFNDAPILARKALELIINSIYGSEKLKNTGSLIEKMENPYFKEVVNDPSILKTLHKIRRTGNDSAHYNNDDDLPKVTQSQVSESIKNLYSICVWYAKTYYNLKNVDYDFDETLLK